MEQDNQRARGKKEDAIRLVLPDPAQEINAGVLPPTSRYLVENATGVCRRQRRGRSGYLESPWIPRQARI